MIDTNEMRRLTQAATPGPWAATTVVTSIGVCHKVGPFPGKTTEHPPRHACLYVDYESADNPADREICANATFIAAANPTAIDELLDRLEAAEKERDTLRAKIAERDELMAALRRVADVQEMSGVFTFADVVLRYQEIARTAIARATGEQT